MGDLWEMSPEGSCLLTYLPQASQYKLLPQDLPAPWGLALNNLDGQVFACQEAHRDLQPCNIAHTPLLHPSKHTSLLSPQPGLPASREARAHLHLPRQRKAPRRHCSAPSRKLNKTSFPPVQTPGLLRHYWAYQQRAMPQSSSSSLGSPNKAPQLLGALVSSMNS